MSTLNRDELKIPSPLDLRAQEIAIGWEVKMLPLEEASGGQNG